MNKKVIEKVKTAESSISMVLGIVVVVVTGIILFNYFKGLINKQKTQETQVNIQPQEEMFDQEVEQGEPAYSGELPVKYRAEKGDSLWKISIKFFGYGYNWLDISRENNLSNPEQIEAGQELTIPNVPIKKPTTSFSQAETANTIEGNSYEIKKGDNLWDICVRAYQDGYRWTEIARINNIANPNIIHPGNTLVLPR